MNYSPLRYPGGKAKLVNLFKALVEENNLDNATYIEPFAGGANVALSLLIDGYVSNIHINDYDFSIYSFWDSVINNTDAFIDKIKKCELSLEEWHRQRDILQSGKGHSKLALGFAAFYLNRTNFSGVVTAGPIGGLKQKGKYKLNARFNKTKLIDRIKLIAKYKALITVTNYEALALIETVKNKPNCIIYFDPPYYIQGRRLYTSFYNHKDHKNLSEKIKNLNMPIVLTYDNDPNIRGFYLELESKEFEINYSANTHGKGKEIMFFNNLPQNTRAFLDFL